MAYTINLTNGTTLTTVEDGTVNSTSCSLTLIGKNYAGYGTFINDNLVHILENSSNDTQPNNPLTGQLWWDTLGNLKIYTGSEFKTLATSISSSTQPSNPVTGNFWWDTVNEQLYSYNGTNWILVGPDISANLGTSGVFFGNIIDGIDQTHVAANITVNSNIVAIVSSELTEYTPKVVISGFGNIKPGINLSDNSVYWGVAENASKLGNVEADYYARTDGVEPTIFSNVIVSNIGLQVGTNSNLVANLFGINARITNTINSGNLSLRANVLGTLTDSVLINGSTGNVEFGGNLTSSSNISTTKNISASAAIISSNVSAGNINVTSNLNINNTLTTNKFVASDSLSLSGNLMYNGYEVLSDSSAVNLKVVSSYFSTTGAWTATMSNGSLGQIKVLMMLADGGNMVITVANAAWGGSGTLTFDTVGDACTLQFMANKWFVIGNNGVTVA